MPKSALCKKRSAKSGVCSKSITKNPDSDSDTPFNSAFSAPSKRARLNQRSEFSSTLQHIVSYHLKPYQGNLAVALLNINSLCSKLIDIQFMLEQQCVDILVINETKLDENDDQSHFEFDHYLCFRRDRKKQGRGLGVVSLFI